MRVSSRFCSNFDSDYFGSDYFDSDYFDSDYFGINYFGSDYFGSDYFDSDYFNSDYFDSLSTMPQMKPEWRIVSYSMAAFSANSFGLFFQ